MNVIAQILNNIKESINQIIKELGIQTDQEIIFEIPRETNHGDYSTNIAMRLARELKQNPRQIAQNIVDKFDFE